jgi:thiamine transport system substrate-binding protein
MLNKTILSLTIFVIMLSGCISLATPAPEILRTITVMTHDSFSISEQVLIDFETQHNLAVKFFKAGDAGTVLNKAILSKDQPLADVLYGLDNTFLSRALAENIFESYSSPKLAEVSESFQLDPQKRALPVDYGDVCLNYDIRYFKDKAILPPINLDDLLKPQYKGMLVVENPATSSPGLAFLLATIGVYGEQAYLEYWRQLVANDLLVVNDWETAYYTEFTAHGGTHPLVVSYASSPPAEVIFAETPMDEAPTAAISAGGSCFRQVEFAGILQGTTKRDLAELWIDFMLSVPFQEDMPLQMFVFPVNSQVSLPAEFVKYTNVPETTAQVSPQQISENRERWIREWTEAILR